MIHATSIMTVSVSRSNVARWIYCACRPSLIVQHGIHHGIAMLLMWNVRCCCLCHFIQIRSSQVMCVLCVYPHQSSSKSISHVKVAFKPMLSEHSCSLLLLNLPFTTCSSISSVEIREKSVFITTLARVRERHVVARAGAGGRPHTGEATKKSTHVSAIHWQRWAVGDRRVARANP